MTKGKHLRIVIVCLFLCTSGVTANDRPFPLFVQLQGVEGTVYGATEIESTLWLPTSKGAFYVYQGQYFALKLDSKDGKTGRQIYCIQGASGAVWLGANDGLFEVIGSEYHRSTLEPFNSLSKFFDVAIRFMTHDKNTNTLWIGTSHGLFLWKPGQPKASIVPFADPRSTWNATAQNIADFLSEDPASPDYDTRGQRIGEQLKSAAVEHVAVIDTNELIVATHDDLFRHTEEKTDRFPFYKQGLLGIKEIIKRDHIYILAFHTNASAGTLYLLSDQLRVLGVSGILDMHAMNNEIWAATSHADSGTTNISIVEGNGLRPISIYLEGSPGLIEVISETSDLQILLSSEAILVRRAPEQGFKMSARKKMRRVRHDDTAFKFSELFESRDGIWLYGSSGVYRSVEATRIDTRLGARETFFLRKKRIFIDEIFYNKNGTDPFPDNFGGQFTALLDFEVGRFNEHRLYPSQFMAASEVSLLSPNDATIQIAAADKFGNLSFTKEAAPEAVVSYPTNIVLVSLGLVFKGALTIFFTTFLASLAATLLLWSVVKLSRDPSRRLNAYIALTKWMSRFSTYRIFLQPRENKMNSEIRDIYLTLLRCTPPAASSWVHDTLDTMAIADDSYHEVVQGFERLDLFTVQSAIAHSQIKTFADKIPVIIRLKNYVGELSGERVRIEVIKSLHNQLPGSDDIFCNDLLRRLSFVFLFSAPSQPKDVIRSIKAFFDSINRDRHFVLVIVVPRVQNP